MDDKTKDFNIIIQAVLKAYKSEMLDYLDNKASGKMPESEVVIMIMNCVISTATHIYYSLKEFFPKSEFDFDFIKAKLINSLVKSFDEIKNYSPKDDLTVLSIDQIKEVIRDGQITIDLPNGDRRIVKEDDLLIKAEDRERLLIEIKKERLDAAKAKAIVRQGKLLTRSKNG